jgi:outer membrane protein assembly factor BamD (BamD/ComL family)
MFDRNKMTVVAAWLALALAAPIAKAADLPHAAMIRFARIYLTPDTSSAVLGSIDRGRDVVIIETTPGWVHVTASLTEEKTVTGWMVDKGVVRAGEPNGDRVLYGEAVDSEDQASRPHGRNNAAQDAMHLYYRVSEYYPASPFAAEAMYRAADIRWQIEKSDVSTRPSSKEKEAFLREGMNEQFMKEVIKKYPGTKWADLAAFHLIENKLCGDWQGDPKCPAKEAEFYEKYANERPQSPATAEALYDAAWRYSALIEMYKTDEQPKKSDESKVKAIALAQKVVTQYPQSDWGARAQRLLYLIQLGIPTYGNAIE